MICGVGFSLLTVLGLLGNITSLFILSNRFDKSNLREHFKVEKHQNCDKYHTFYGGKERGHYHNHTIFQLPNTKKL